MSAKTQLTVDLGPEHEILERHLQTGEFEDASELLREALGALDREQVASSEVLKRKVAEALADPRPGIPMEDVFERLKKRFPLVSSAR